MIRSTVFCVLASTALIVGCASKPSDDGFPSPLLPISTVDGFGYIDQKGKVVVKPHLLDAQPPTEGLAVVILPDRRRAYLNGDGSFAFTLPREVVFAGLFSEGLALVNISGTPGEIDDSAVYGGKWGWIDRTGKFAIEPRAYNLEGEEINQFIYRLGRFSHGRAAVPVEGGWGFIDRAGTVVIPGPYDQVERFHNGAAHVMTIRDRQIAPNTSIADSTEMYIKPDGKVIWRYATDE